MTSTLFSPLSRGIGSWEGDLEPQTKKNLAKSTQSQLASSSPKKDAASCLTKTSLKAPLRKKDDLTIIHSILQDTTGSYATRSSSPTKTPLPSNYNADVLRANTPKPIQARSKSAAANTRFHRAGGGAKDISAQNSSPPAVRPKTALSGTVKSRVQSAASATLSDRVKSAPARRLRTRTAPPVVERKALIPKTLTTRKGALLLFAAPGDFDFTQPDGQQRLFMPTGPPNVSQLGSQLGTTNKLTASVLQYGNQNYPSDMESFNSQYDKTCMKFVQEDDDDFTLDYRAQPGGDFVFYLRDMKARQSIRHLVRSPSLYSISSIDTVEELNDALRSIEIDGEVMGPDGDEVRSQRSTLITADADRLAETISRPSTALDPISRPTTGGVSRASTCKTRASRPSTSKSMCSSTPLSAEKLAASIRSSPYLGHPIQAPYPPSMMSVENIQDEVQSTHTGPGSRPGSMNSIRSVTIKSRKSSARSSARRSAKSGMSGGMSEHGDEFDEALSEHGEDEMSDGLRSISRAASSHHESWPDESDAELVIEEDDELALDPSRPNSSRPMSSRRSRRASARRSASLKDRSRSHVSGAGEGEDPNDLGNQDDSRSQTPIIPSAKSVAMPTDDNILSENMDADEEAIHSSPYGSRPTSRRSQFSYASASTSIPMGSEIDEDIDFAPGDDQLVEEQRAGHTSNAGTPKAVTPIAVTPQGTKSKSPRPSSWQQNTSVASEHPPDITIDQEEEENVEDVVEDVIQEVLDVADEVQDVVLDIDMTDVPKGPKMSICEAENDIARALRRHSQISSSQSQNIPEDETKLPPIDTSQPPSLPDVGNVKPESLPPTVAPLKAPSPVPVKEEPPAPVKVPVAPVPIKKKVMIAATPIKAKSRSPSPVAKPVKVDLGSLVKQQMPPRIPPSKKEKKGGAKKKKGGGGGGGRGRSRSPPPMKMEFIDSVVVDKFEEPTEEEFEKMLQEELAQELAENNMNDLLPADKPEEKPAVEDDVNSLATDDEAIEKQMKNDTKAGGKKRSKKQMSKDKAALKEERRQEKMRREEEKQQLEEKKKEREAEKRRQEQEDRQRREELAEELANAEEEAKRAAEEEEEVRQMLAEQRRLAREERDSKRKAEIEKKKLEKERQREARKKMEDAARGREREMAERLASAAERKKMREEAEIEQQEQDRIEREQREYEEEEEMLRLQEEEEKIRELEREAEEEAMHRLVKEREEANKKRLEAKKEAERLELLEEAKREEERKRQAELDELRRLQELEEEKRRMEELEKNEKLKMWEENARERVRKKLEARRRYLMKVRDKNRERRVHLNSVRQSQGMTRSWTFSYYVHWPRDTYEKRLPSKKKDTRRTRPKPPPKPAGEESAQASGGTNMTESGV